MAVCALFVMVGKVKEGWALISAQLWLLSPIAKPKSAGSPSVQRDGLPTRDQRMGLKERR